MSPWRLCPFLLESIGCLSLCLIIMVWHTCAILDYKCSISKCKNFRLLMTNPLEALKIDFWYKAVLVLSAVLLIISLTVPLQGAENTTVIQFSLGGVLIGLGEWINHPFQTKVGDGFKITGYPRNNSALGIIFNLIGFGIMSYSACEVLF